MPWTPGDGHGFTRPGVRPWLPFGEHAGKTVAEQREDPDSALTADARPDRAAARARGPPRGRLRVAARARRRLGVAARGAHGRRPEPHGARGRARPRGHDPARQPPRARRRGGLPAAARAARGGRARRRRARSRSRRRGRVRSPRSGTGPVAQPVFKTGPAAQPVACLVRLRGRSVQPFPAHRGQRGRASNRPSQPGSLTLLVGTKGGYNPQFSSGLTGRALTTGSTQRAGCGPVLAEDNGRVTPEHTETLRATSPRRPSGRARS